MNIPFHLLLDARNISAVDKSTLVADSSRSDYNRLTFTTTVDIIIMLGSFHERLQPSAVIYRLDRYIDKSDAVRKLVAFDRKTSP